MAKAKRAAERRTASLAATPPKPVESAFERISHRRHFDIVGRKLKGGTTNLAQARSEATEKRKRTLLQEYRQHGKAGGFIDRRFGEHDDAADADEKALWRMQRLRQMHFGRASRFALADEGDEDVLTHMGTSLNELDGRDDFVPSDEDDDHELNEAITREYHFCGGDLFTRKAHTGGEPEDGVDGAEPHRKTKKEVMSEIIAKSKSAKRERVKEKEADDEQLDALDLTFKALADAGALRGSLRSATGHLKPAKASERRHKGRTSVQDVEEDDDFDALAHELARDARASRVADRLKTAEEQAAETAAQLEELERKRLKRARQRGSDEDESDDDEDAPKGGYAAKRLKLAKRDSGPDAPKAASRHHTGDDLDENYALEQDDDADEASDGSDEYTGSGSDSDGAEDAPDDVRCSFKDHVGSVKVASDLHRGLRRLRRLGILKDGGDAGDSSSASDGEGGSGEDEEADDDEDEGEEEGDEDEKSSEQDSQECRGGVELAPGEVGRAARDIEKTHEAVPNDTAKRRAGPQHAAVPAPFQAEPQVADLPYTFDAPASHAEFAGWVSNRSAEELSVVIQRVCACNAIALAPDNRRKMQVFFGVLLVHFDSLAQQLPLPQRHLDALVPHILAVSREVPFYAATAAVARLVRMQKAAAESLASGAAKWPPARSILLMRLFTLMFPASDFRHPVLTPMAVLLGQYLAHSEVRGGHDAAVGVLIAEIAVRLARASRRFVPEAIAFLSGMVHAAAEAGSAALEGLPAHLAHQVGGPWLHPAAVKRDARPAAASNDLPVWRVLGTPPEDAFFDSPGLRAAVLHAAVRTLASVADDVAALPAGEALLAPARNAVERLMSAACSKRMSQGAMASVAAIVAAHRRAASALHPPLQLHKRKREAIKTFNPRFEEEGFVQGRDYDIDRERSEARRLKKQIAREAKGAVRELRKDNRFLAEERTRMKQAEAAEREGKYRAAMTFLEQQEADFKSGGQGGAVKGRRKGA